jgi:N6-adenosine-specific RNA methylase IME4
VSAPTRAEIDALVGPATPHFAFQLRARVQELVADLAEDDAMRLYGEEQMELLERLGFSSSKAEDGGRESKTRPGWDTIPSSAPVDSPLPR